MLKQIATVLLYSALVVGCATSSPRAALRIDAASAETAEATYQAMMQGRSAEQRQKLALAVLMLNMQSVKSAHELVGNLSLQAPSIARIRGQVAGLTAEEIIALAAKNPSVRIEVSGQ